MTDSNMPTTYETRTTTTTSGTTIGLHPEYLRTIPGILKIVEIVLDIITFICAIATPWWAYYGGGWVQFVAMSAFITTLILFIFYLTGIYHRLPGPWMLIILSLITFICTCVWWWGSAQGWAQFVSMSAFLSTLVYLILHLLNLISRFPGPWLLIEFIYYCVFTVFYLIAAIVCAAKASHHASIGAAAFFAFAATIAYAIDTFMQFRQIRFTRASGGGEAAAGTPAQSPSSTEKGGRF